MLDLQPIKNRLAAATPGPWEAKEASSPSRRHTFFPVAVVGRWEVIADLPSQARPDERDADLIAHAPADLAALVAEVERLRGEIEAHRRTTSLRLGGARPWVTDAELWEALDV